jgi:hypothetical protein
VSVPASSALVTHVATPGFPLNTDAAHPVFPLQLTLPVGASRVATNPFPPVTVAVNVSDCP